LIELGPKPEHEIERALGRDVTAERLTRLDTEIGISADELGVVDLRIQHPGPDDPSIRRLMIGRFKHLETMGLAAEITPGQWVMGEGAKEKLHDLGARGDIIRTMGEALAAHGKERALADYVIDGGAPERPIIGRLIDKGLHHELTGTAYAIIDGIDGNVHHVRFPGIEALEHSPPLGGIVEVRVIGASEGRKPILILATRSDMDLAAQVNSRGATWLDHRMIERGAGLVNAGFGGEVQRAVQQRADQLVREGLAQRHGTRTVFARNLLDTLRNRELDGVGAKLARQNGLSYRPVKRGETVSGICRQRLSLASGRFAMVDNGLGFSLVPWSHGLERQLGREISGIIRDGGGIDWAMGRKRDLGR